MFGARSPEAYERLLLDVMLGDATLFMRRDSVEAVVALDHADSRALGLQRPLASDLPPPAAGDRLRRDADRRHRTPAWLTVSWASVIWSTSRNR